MKRGIVGICIPGFTVLIYTTFCGGLPEKLGLSKSEKEGENVPFAISPVFFQSKGDFCKDGFDLWLSERRATRERLV